jgi:DUF1016 N-terminal domain
VLDSLSKCLGERFRLGLSGELYQDRQTLQDLPWRDAPWLIRLFTTLPFSHLLELSRIDDLTRRAFYELHCLKERWSVRELQRQMDSLPG